jgi:hypothetical protein
MGCGNLRTRPAKQGPVAGPRQRQAPLQASGRACRRGAGARAARQQHAEDHVLGGHTAGCRSSGPRPPDDARGQRPRRASVVSTRTRAGVWRKGKASRKSACICRAGEHAPTPPRPTPAPHCQRDHGRPRRSVRSADGRAEPGGAFVLGVVGSSTARLWDRPVRPVVPITRHGPVGRAVIGEITTVAQSEPVIGVAGGLGGHRIARSTPAACGLVV